MLLTNSSSFIHISLDTFILRINIAATGYQKCQIQKTPYNSLHSCTPSSLLPHIFMSNVPQKAAYFSMPALFLQSLFYRNFNFFIFFLFLSACTRTRIASAPITIPAVTFTFINSLSMLDLPPTGFSSPTCLRTTVYNRVHNVLACQCNVRNWLDRNCHNQTSGHFRFLHNSRKCSHRIRHGL